VVRKGNSEERLKKRELLMLIDSTSKDEVRASNVNRLYIKR
jgi:hypothetical protein